MKLAQFRMKDIIDMETGEVLLELEHEIRCRYANRLSPLLHLALRAATDMGHSCVGSGIQSYTIIDTYP